MARRTGLPTLRQLGRAMCRIITAWGPVIRLVYPANTALHAAIAAAMSACEVMVAEIDDQISGEGV